MVVEKKKVKTDCEKVCIANSSFIFMTTIIIIIFKGLHQTLKEIKQYMTSCHVLEMVMLR